MQNDQPTEEAEAALPLLCETHIAKITQPHHPVWEGATSYCGGFLRLSATWLDI